MAKIAVKNEDWLAGYNTAILHMRKIINNSMLKDEMKSRLKCRMKRVQRLYVEEKATVGDVINDVEIV